MGDQGPESTSGLLKVTQSVGGRVETEPRAPKVQPGVLSTGASGCAQSRSWLPALAKISARMKRSVMRGHWYQLGPANCSGLEPDKLQLKAFTVQVDLQRRECANGGGGYF